MQPQQTPPANQPPVNPYDFLYNTPQPKRGFNLPTGNSKSTRILLVVGGVVILIVLAIMFMSLLTSGSKSNTQRLINVANRQQEVIRVSALGLEKARTADARNLAITTQYSTITSQQETLALLKKNGHKLNNKDLSVGRKSSTDKTLEAANLNNTFDSAFLGILYTELNEYRKNVRETYDGSQSKKEKQILGKAFSGTSLVLPQQAGSSNSNL